MHNLPAFNQIVHGFDMIPVPAPAPAMGFVHTVPLGQIISPTTCNFLFDTDSISVTRQIEIDILANGAMIYMFRDYTMIDDDLVASINLSAGATRVHANTGSETIVLPFPANLFLAPGDIFSVILLGAAAADQMSMISLHARTWTIPA